MTTINEGEMRLAISSTWWIPLMQGIIAILLGIYVLMRPGQTLIALMLILGLYWIANGIFTAIAAIAGKTNQSRFLQLLGGILLVIIGVTAVSYPVIASVVSAATMATFIGVLAIFGGITQMIAGREIMGGVGFEWSWSSFFMGLFNLIFGLLVLAVPYFSYIVFVRIMAFWTIIGGSYLIYVSFKVRTLEV